MAITVKAGTIQGYFTGTGGSTALAAGTPVYFDGTDWEKADATDNTKFAEAVVVVPTSSAGGTVGLATSAVLVDSASGYTQGDQYYLSATAGAITATRPTGANNLKQVIGFGLSTAELRVDIAMVREQTLWVDLPYAGGSAAVTIDGDWAGLSMTADADAAHGTQMFPENTVGLEIAYLWAYVEDELAGGSYTIDVSAGVDDQAGTAHEDGITATVLSPTTADDLVRDDVTAAFDAAGLVDPGNHFGVDVAKASETAADDYRFHGVAVVVLVV